MKAPNPRPTIPLRGAIAALLWLHASGTALFAVEQSISLQAGWNAVWLEVEPQTAEGLPTTPELAFATATNTAITLIASPKPLAGLAETFGADPSSENGTFNQDSWETWKRVDPPGANNLGMVTGNRGYLIQSTSALTITVAGEAEFRRPQWTPDRYNLIGFGIDPAAAPSFDTFFAPSGGRHPVARIYALGTNGTWSTVSGSASLGDGVAYWIFCRGTSNYMGPVAVDLPHANSRRLDFGGQDDAVTVNTLSLDLEELVFTNLGSATATPGLELIQKDSGSESLLLHVVNPANDSLAYVLGNAVDTSENDGTSAALGETVTAGATAVLTLGAEPRNWVGGAVARTNVYRLSTGGGTQFWLPISASMTTLQLPSDLLPESPAAKVAGLWVGDVVIDSVTSIVEDGSPVVRPASSRAPLRLLLHSDAGGAVRLLSQVTIMQTRTSEPEVPPVPVLVVDQARIPFFEGVRERGGKRVGLRLDAAAFDMPRKLDATSQAALLTAAGITEAQLPGYLQSQSLRPPSLEEIYHLSWPLEGAIGAGKTVQTVQPPIAAPLTIDPFHRSNPFRHAFHQKHARGPSISRTLEIVFEENASASDQLRGTYQETITGLTQEELILTGPITLQRVSPVASLAGSN